MIASTREQGPASVEDLVLDRQFRGRLEPTLQIRRHAVEAPRFGRAQRVGIEREAAGDAMPRAREKHAARFGGVALPAALVFRQQLVEAFRDIFGGFLRLAGIDRKADGKGAGNGRLFHNRLMPDTCG